MIILICTTEKRYQFGGGPALSAKSLQRLAHRFRLALLKSHDPTVATGMLDKVPVVLDVPHLDKAVMRGRMSVDRKGRAVIACVRVAGKRRTANLRLSKRGKCQDECRCSK